MLSDPQKKAAFDQYGSAAFDQSGGFNPGGGDPFAGAQGGFGAGFGGFGGGTGGINFEDLFGAAFGGGARRGRRGGSAPFQEEVLIGDNIEVQTNISFMDAAKGIRKDIHITPLVTCKTCTGSGMKKGTQKSTCHACEGTGQRVHFMQGGFQMASTCGACGGQGTATPRGGECNTCKGDGVEREKRTVSIDIPGGVEDGMRLRVTGEGDAASTGRAANPKSRSTNGDLYVLIRVAADTKFSRNGSDILYTASIPLTTAILGGEMRIPTLDAEVKVRVATGTSTGDRITLPGMGMKKLSGRRNGNGDLKVEFKVQMPKYLSANQRTIVEMLADEMGDKTAKRVMNFGKSQDQTSTADSTEQPTASKDKDEGILKSAWHKFTHSQEKQEKSQDSKPQQPVDQQQEEPKKSSGSGSA